MPGCFHVVQGVSDGVVLIQDEGGADNSHHGAPVIVLLTVSAVSSGNGFVRVGDKREGEVFFVCEGREFVCGVGGDPNDRVPGTLEGRQRVAEVTRLGGATGSASCGVKVQDHFLARRIGKRKFLTCCSGGGESGCGCSGFKANRHDNLPQGVSINGQGHAIGTVEGVNDSTNTSDTTPGRAAPQLPVRMLHDRVLVHPEKDTTERQSSAGLVIPATAVGPKKLAWALVAALGDNVRQVRLGDRVLFDPEDRAEVDIAGTDYVLLREKDIHAVAQADESERPTGLYL